MLCDEVAARDRKIFLGDEIIWTMNFLFFALCRYIMREKRDENMQGNYALSGFCFVSGLYEWQIKDIIDQIKSPGK